jgi:uncharacterized membrane protein YeiB
MQAAAMKKIAGSADQRIALLDILPGMAVPGIF